MTPITPFIDYESLWYLDDDSEIGYLSDDDIEHLEQSYEND